MRRLAHQLIGLEERAEHVEDLVEAGALAELAQLVALGVREIGGLRVRRGLEHEREPQELDDVARERQEVFPVARRAVDGLERRAGVVPDHRRRERAHRHRSRRAEQLRGRLRLEPAFAVGDRRVEQ